MPAQSQWLVRLPKIIQQLQTLDVPVIDRATVEKLFGVARRRAIHLMNEFGGYQSGRTLLVDRRRLITLLSAQASGDAFEYENRRRERIADKLAALQVQAKGVRISVPVEPAVLQSTRSTLPPGVEVDKGTLTVRFTSNEELAQKLFAVAQALMNDFESFEK